ncbi:hypothetical protein [Clostridium thermobutyricum]|uniref:hypothetical protein n=1 Tax=Clostridium thermobutyricum TaxID=29372 RepID=UPI003F51E2EB
MNKLEVLYKMSKAMKEKEKISGTVNLVGISEKGEFANIANNFEKDIKNKKMKIDAKLNVNTEEVKAEKDIVKEFDFEKLHEGHRHGGHHCGRGNGHMHGHGRCGNKFEKLEFLFKTLNDMELSEEGDLKVITLDIKDIIKKKKEKMKEFHKNHEHHGHHHHMEDGKCEELKEVFKIKHAIFKEILSCESEKAVLRLIIDKDFTIKSVEVKSEGDKKVEFKADLNY